MSINIKELSYTYQPNTPFEHQALQNINLSIKDGSYTAIIGHTGSGKSTLLQHLNGLLKPSSGELIINGRKITSETKNKELGDLRREVGFVFQFPEAQLFEETVLKDIAFAPKNFGKSQDEAFEIAMKKAKLVGLKDSLFEKSPFELSGGQMRRVAIAGILAMNPKILVLDEPTAGLDPKGRIEMMELFKRLHKKDNLTIVLVTHNMNDVANYASQVIILENGRVIEDTTPRKIFDKPKWLLKHHLGLPQTTEIAYDLSKRGIDFESLPLNEKEFAKVLSQKMRGMINE